MAMSHRMGQKHTIITADQPLDIRGKELVWGNPSLKVASFSMEDSTSALTSSKANLSNTWTVQERMTNGMTQVYIPCCQSTPTYEAL